MSSDWPAFSSDEFLSVLRDVYFPGAPAAIVECEGLRVRGLLNGRSKLVSGFWPFPFYLEPLREFDGAALFVPYVENVVLASGDLAAQGPAGATPAPYVDWRTVESWEAYAGTRTPSPGIDSPGTVERKTRRLERELGALVFQRDDPDPAVFEAVIEWKRRQYRRTGLFDLFSVERNRAFYDELRRRDMCTVSSLRAGGKLVAGSIGNVIDGRFLGRMPAYDPAFGAYSPGSILNLLMLKASFAAGDLEFDFLIGAEPYKYTYATHVRWVGSVGREPGRAKISRIVRDKIGPTAPYRAVRTTASRVARRLPGGSARNGREAVSDSTSKSAQRRLPEAVLFAGGSEGVRLLGQKGVPVVVVRQGVGPSAARSPYGSRALFAPDGWATNLDDWFERQTWPTGAAVLAGSDFASWWLARRVQDENKPDLSYGTPGLKVISSLLLKSRLFDLCRQAGVPAPKTWLLEGDRLSAQLLAEATFPLVVKPQSRVGMQGWIRARLVRDESELAETISWFRRNIRFNERIASDEPSIELPVVQECVEADRDEVYHLLGYRSRGGELVVAAHRKLLQYPRRFGNGLCFESDEVDPVAASNLELLLNLAGYWGIFEAEYLERDGQKLLIDLNPRDYNGISLEIERGYLLQWYLYLDTIGETALLTSELERAQALAPPALVWRDGPRFWTMLACQTLSGGMSPRSAWRWVSWSRANRSKMVDPIALLGSRKAMVRQLSEHLHEALRHPRAFVGTYFSRGWPG